MSFVETLAAFLKRPAAETKGKTPPGVCANCWGYYEYDGMYREFVRDKHIDVMDGRAHLNFMEDFVETHINGIRLQEKPEGLICPTCERKQNG